MSADMIKVYNLDYSSSDSIPEIIAGPVGIRNQQELLRDPNQLQSPQILKFVRKYVEFDAGHGDSGASASSSRELPGERAVVSCCRRSSFGIACDQSHDSNEETRTSTGMRQNKTNSCENQSIDYDNQPNSLNKESDVSDHNDLESILQNKDIIHGRYKYDVLLGTGAYGWVVKCFDHQEQNEVAVKICKQRLLEDTSNDDDEEIEILDFLKNADSGDEHHLVRFKEHFIWQDRTCLVFELLGMNLREYIQRKGSLPLTEIQKLGHQICDGLKFLSRPEIGIIHCDLKPENILLSKSGVKIADFGISQKIGGKLYLYIQTRYYRAPEVLLGIPYNSAIDMWSLGCVLAELYLGRILFKGNHEIDQMNIMVEVLGMPPLHLLNNGTCTDTFFDEIMPREWYVLKPTEEEYMLPQTRSLYTIMPFNSRRNNDVPAFCAFLDLIKRILVYDPENRISATAALDHKFLKYPS